MLSTLVITPQKCIIIVDELSQDKISQKFVSQLLKEQGEEEANIKILALNDQLNNEATLQKFLNEFNVKLLDSEGGGGKKWNVVLPNFSDFLAYQKPAAILQFLKKLKNTETVKRCFLWISPQHIQHDHAQYLISACEYMADLVLHIYSKSELSILTRKAGGGVTYKHYTFTKTKTEFLVELRKDNVTSGTDKDNSTNQQKPEQLGTFKIELDEEEMVARNSMKMPYEKALEPIESNIIYTPDAADDYDDEDPDEDLDI